LSVRIEEPQTRISGADDETESPEGQGELRSEFGDFGALVGWRREHQFVVVAAGELALTSQQWVYSRRQWRQLRHEDLCGNAGALEDMIEIGE